MFLCAILNYNKASKYNICILYNWFKFWYLICQISYIEHPQYFLQSLLHRFLTIFSHYFPLQFFLHLIFQNFWTSKFTSCLFLIFNNLFTSFFLNCASKCLHFNIQPLIVLYNLNFHFWIEQFCNWFTVLPQDLTELHSLYKWENCLLS